MHLIRQCSASKLYINIPHYIACWDQGLILIWNMNIWNSLLKFSHFIAIINLNTPSFDLPITRPYTQRIMNSNSIKFWQNYYDLISEALLQLPHHPRLKFLGQCSVLKARSATFVRARCSCSILSNEQNLETAQECTTSIWFRQVCLFFWLDTVLPVHKIHQYHNISAPILSM